MFRKKKRSLEDFRAEIDSHLAHQAEQIRDTKRDADPEGAARRLFGNVTAVEEARYECEHWMWLDHLSRDLRLAARQMKNRPGFSLMVILTLALGIGANSAIFSIVQAVLLRPLPYKDPSQLAMIFAGDPARELQEGRTSLLNFEDWKAQSRSFEDMTVFVGQTFLLGTDGSPERMRSARVPANFWSLLGVKPMLGRVFTLEEEKRRERVAVLSYKLWKQQFGGSRNALGANLVMDGRSYRIIGVMPPQFQFPFPDSKVWEPITAHPYWTTRDRKDPRASFIWLAMGRLKRGVSWIQAQEEMSAIERRLQARYPDSHMPGSAAVLPLDIQATGKFRLSLWLLFGSVFVMLLIVCINTAGLLLARGSARKQEFAVRHALGAKRARLAFQLLVETMTLAVCGGVLGLFLASAATRAIKAFAPTDIPRLSEAHIDWQVTLFAAGITVFTALFASLWPMLESNRAQLGSRQSSSLSTRRIRNVLVAGEFALALILISVAGLLIRSFLQLHAVELGFRPDHLLVMRIDLHVGRTADQQAAYFEDAIHRAESLAGVRFAGAVEGFLRTDPEDSVEVEGRPPQHPGPCEDLIAGHYFEAAGIPLLQGRFFSDRDRGNSLPVAIINQKMARAYWPTENPIGKRFRFTRAEPWLTVVGVTGDMRRQGIEREVAPQVFRPHRQGSEDMMDVIVRTRAEPAAIAAVIRNQIQGIDKTVAKFNVVTADQELGEQTVERRFDLFLVSTFAFAALFLSAIGIYGLLHQLVVQRTHEVGVRMALGASRGAVTTLMLRQGLTLACLGTATGLVGSLSVSWLLSKFLYGITPTDPISFGCSVLLLLLAGGIACWIPSRRAARIDPVVVLRQD